MLLVPAAAGAEPVDTVLSSALLRDHKAGVRVPADVAGADARLAALSDPSRDADRDLERFDALNGAFNLERSLLDELADPEGAGFGSGVGLHDGILERFDAGAGGIVERLAFDENLGPTVATLMQSRELLSRAVDEAETNARHALAERRIIDQASQLGHNPPNDPVERDRAADTVFSLIDASGLSEERRRTLAGSAKSVLSNEARAVPAFELSAGSAAPMPAEPGSGEALSPWPPALTAGNGRAHIRPATPGAAGIAFSSDEGLTDAVAANASDLGDLNAEHADAPLVPPDTAAQRYQSAKAFINANRPAAESDLILFGSRFGLRAEEAKAFDALGKATLGQAENDGNTAIDRAFGDTNLRLELRDLYANLQSTDDPQLRRALFDDIASVWAKSGEDGTKSPYAPKASDAEITAAYRSRLRALFDAAGGVSSEQFITALNAAGLDIDMGLALHALLGATPEDAGDQHARLLIERAFQDMPQVQAALTEYLDELQVADNPAVARAWVLDALAPMLPLLLEDPSAVPELRPLLAQIAADRRNIDARSDIEQLAAFGRMVLDTIPGIGNVLSAHDAALAAIAAYDAFQAGETWEGTKDALAALLATVGAVPALSTVVKGGRLAANAARGILRMLGAASRRGRGALDDAAARLMRRRSDDGSLFDASRDVRRNLDRDDGRSLLESIRREDPFARRDSLDREIEVPDAKSDAAAYNHIFEEGSPELEDARRTLAARGVVAITLDAKKYRGAAGHIQRARTNGAFPTILTLARSGARRRRRFAIRGWRSRAIHGLDRDEFPPAVSREGGAGSSIAYIERSDNRGAGADMGHKLKHYDDDTKFALLLTVPKIE